MRASDVIKSLVNELRKYKRIFLQVPEGLKRDIWDIVREIEKLGVECIVDSEPVYGFCDLKDEEALRLGCDAILHIGHNSFGFEHLLKSSKLPVIICEYKFGVDKERLLKILDSELDTIKTNSPIGLVSSLQYINYIYEIKEYLEDRGVSVVVPKNPQILGCNFVNAKQIEEYVNAYLIPTSGIFYPLGLALNTNRKVFGLDLDRERLIDMDVIKDKYLRIIYWNIQKFKNSEKVCILQSWKKGQIFYDPINVKNFLKRLGKDVLILAMEEITESKILGIKCDILINVSCPRIFDDYERFNVPILNFRDLLRFDKETYKKWIEK